MDFENVQINFFSFCAGDAQQGYVLIGAKEKTFIVEPWR